MAAPGESDWRLQGQERFLSRVKLVWRPYRRYPANPEWRRDHCEFCWATFMLEHVPDVHHEGYCTLDEYRWICRRCFEDFAERFQWKVVTGSEQ